MNEIYFDNSATTRLCCSSVKAMTDVMENIYGNPSSLHALGHEAEKAVRLARKQILDALSCTDNGAKIVFCASGTEADNLALRGVAHSKERYKGGRIVISNSEHPAIEETAKSLEKEGFEVVRLSTRNGVIDKDELMGAVNDRTFLVSIMAVNNETGAVYDVGELFSLIKAKNPDTVTHTDAVQAFMKIPMSPARQKADLITLSSHKIHGPKGIGALYASGETIKKKNLSPVIFGGGQEEGLRSGTENTVGIVGFGAACEERKSTLAADHKHISELKEYIISRLPRGITVKAPQGVWAPHIINITLPNIKSETMLHFLSAKGIYVSSGSACSSHGNADNRVLAAFGTSKRDADCSLRISLCRYNTEEEADALIEALQKGIDEIVQI